MEKQETEIENLKHIYEEGLRLNFDLQKKVISIFEQSEDVEASKSQMLRGVYNSRQCYETAKFNAKGVISLFVINISIFTIEVLLVSSVGESVCNKTKSQPLNGTKLAAVDDITRYQLEELGKNEVEIGIEMGKIGKTINSKIQDLRWGTRSRKTKSKPSSAAVVQDDDSEKENIPEDDLTPEKDDVIKEQEVAMENKNGSESEHNSYSENNAEIVLGICNV